MVYEYDSMSMTVCVVRSMVECIMYYIQCGAVSFIENVRAKNLRIQEEEFNVKMGYVDGKTDVDLFLEEGEVEEEEDHERIMVLGVSGEPRNCVIHSLIIVTLSLQYGCDVFLGLCKCLGLIQNVASFPGLANFNLTLDLRKIRREKAWTISSCDACPCLRHDPYSIYTNLIYCIYRA